MTLKEGGTAFMSAYKAPGSSFVELSYREEGGVVQTREVLITNEEDVDCEVEYFWSSETEEDKAIFLELDE